MILTVTAFILGLTCFFIHFVAQREIPPVSPEEQREFQTALSAKRAG